MSLDDKLRELLLEQVTQSVNTLRGKGYTAMKARQTACIKGHELKVLTTTGHRYCPTCTNIRSKLFKAAKRASGIE